MERKFLNLFFILIWLLFILILLSIGTSFLSTFFAIYYTVGSGTDVYINPFDNDLKSLMRTILFGMYHITNISILINMLIAMMTQSFESIIVNIVIILFLNGII